MNEQEFLDVQNSFREKINLTDSFKIDDIKTVAGVDLAYWTKNGQEYAVCCIVVIDFITHEVLEKNSTAVKQKFRTLPDFLRSVNCRWFLKR